MTEEERKERKRENRKKWLEAHPDYYKKWNEAHRDEMREYRREYRRREKERLTREQHEERRKKDAARQIERAKKRTAYAEHAGEWLAHEAHRNQGKNMVADYFEQESAQDIAQRYFKNYGE